MAEREDDAGTVDKITSLPECQRWPTPTQAFELCLATLDLVKNALSVVPKRHRDKRCALEDTVGRLLVACSAMVLSKDEKDEIDRRLEDESDVALENAGE